MTAAESPKQDRAPASRKVVWGAIAGLATFRLLARTWRIREHNHEPMRALRARHAGFVLAFWHHDMLPMLWAHVGEQVVVLVSEHGDGEIIARIIERSGNRTVRGSTSRGGARALIGMIRELERGAAAAVTPDGPRGPRHQWQSGVVTAARRAKVPIICVGVAADRAWYFKSWDRFVLPKFFARIHLVYSEPLSIEDNGRDVEEEAPRFAALMDDVARRASEAMARG